jgi:diguanylate cyclase (GGDEF)-like protein
MYKISVSKDLFEEILLKKTNILKKENTKYWKKELLEVKILNDKLSYSIKSIDKLIITNGLGNDKPYMKVECLDIVYSPSKECFEFYLGKVLEQKNTQIEENYKDILIERLIKEKLELQNSLNKDHLTQVYNRRKMEDDLNIFINQKNAFMLTAIFIDIDRFKEINDNFGHDIGDKVLEHISKILRVYAKKLNGEVYRFGGEEFVIFSFIAKDRIITILNELKNEVKSNKMYHPKRDISISISMGISFYDDYKDKKLFIKKADLAVYEAKKNGRDRIEFAN